MTGQDERRIFIKDKSAPIPSQREKTKPVSLIIHIHKRLEHASYEMPPIGTTADNDILLMTEILIVFKRVKASLQASLHKQ